MRNKAIHIALGVRADGTKEVLGLWVEQNEGAKFWLRVMNELKNRGTEDVLVAVVDTREAQAWAADHQTRSEDSATETSSKTFIG